MNNFSYILKYAAKNNKAELYKSFSKLSMSMSNSYNLAAPENFPNTYSETEKKY